MNANEAKALMLEAGANDLQGLVSRLSVAKLEASSVCVPMSGYDEVEAALAGLRDGWVARVGDVGDRGPTRKFVLRLGSSEELAVRGQGRIVHAQGVYDDTCLKTLHIDFDGEQWRLITLEEKPEGTDHLVRVHRVVSHESGTAEHEYRTYYELAATHGDASGLKTWQPIVSRYVCTHARALPETSDNGVGANQEETAEGAAE